jgi:hypothetical protein
MVNATLDGDMKNMAFLNNSPVFKSAKKLFLKNFSDLAQWGTSLMKYLVFCVKHCIAEGKSEAEFQTMCHYAALHHIGVHSHCLESSRCEKKDFVPSRPVLATSAHFERFQALLGNIADRNKNFLGPVVDSSAENFFKVFS